MPSKRATVRRLRMRLDFEVEVEELTNETLREYYRRFPDFEETVENRGLWANIGRQIPSWSWRSACGVCCKLLLSSVRESTVRLGRIGIKLPVR